MAVHVEDSVFSTLFGMLYCTVQDVYAYASWQFPDFQVSDAVWNLLCILCFFEGFRNIPQKNTAGGGIKVCGQEPSGPEKAV